MKSYTDLEQSRKLAEILPIESADMEYLSIKETGKLVGNIPFVKDDSEVEDSAYSHTYDRIACWSLASLFGVLSSEIDTHKQTDGYKTYYYVELYMKRMGKEIYLSTERHENLVDVCYEMIIKLYEQKLL
jgi:hypothetical protein